MAAKPPKPPATLLNQHKSNNNSGANSINNNNNNQSDDKKITAPNLNKSDKIILNNSYQTSYQSNSSPGNQSDNIYNSINQSDTLNGDDNKDFVNTSSKQEEVETIQESIEKPSCNCTNISIMHLFHEMKQKFPTIPDQIVTQCVNENCHQRENCIQMLNNELALNPLPNQAYPSKIFQKPKTISPVSTPISGNSTSCRPVRVAPPQPKPSTKEDLLLAISALNFVEKGKVKNENYSHNNEESLAGRSNSLSKSSSENSSSICTQSSQSTDMPLGSTKIINNATVAYKNNGSPSLSNSTSSSSIDNNSYYNGKDNNIINNSSNVNEETNENNLPRARPTTLNIQTHEQQQQQQQNSNAQQNKFKQMQNQINVLLQNRAIQQNQKENQKSSHVPQRPLRKAPLPPLPPKPSQFSSPHQIPTQVPSTLSQQQQQQQQAQLAFSQQNSFSTDSSSSCVTSPLSSTESEISVNISLSSPTTSLASASSTPAALPSVSQLKQLPPTKPATRVRTFITVQPEPPYTRNFFASPPATSSNSGKSFTSVNLTLRQPNTNVNSTNGQPGLGASSQSTIDISAGPSINGNGSTKGLTYSSSSYDPRLGLQKNFHITVTDEGSVVSATSLRPSRFNTLADKDNKYQNTQQQHQSQTSQIVENNINPNNNNQSCYYDNNLSESLNLNNFDKQSSIDAISQLSQQQQQQQSNQLDKRNEQEQEQYSQYTSQQQQQYEQLQEQQQKQLQEGFTVEMCYKRDTKGPEEKIQKQKKCRDALANELRKSKLRRMQLDQEMSILANPLSADEVERLENEVENLRRACQALTAAPAVPALQLQAQHSSNLGASTSLTTSPTQNYHQEQPQSPPQPFPRQKATRSLPHISAGSNTSMGGGFMTPNNPSVTSSDFIQHHRSTTNSPQQQSPVVGGSLTPQQQQQQLLEQFQYQRLQQQILLQQQEQQQQVQQIINSQQQSTAPISAGAHQSPSQPYFSTDIDDYVNSSDEEGDDEDEEENLERWACSLCTFRNHPQLNICECCENVRVLPGTIRIIPSSASSSSIPNSPLNPNLANANPLSANLCQ